MQSLLPKAVGISPRVAGFLSAHRLVPLALFPPEETGVSFIALTLYFEVRPFPGRVGGWGGCLQETQTPVFPHSGVGTGSSVPGAPYLEWQRGPRGGVGGRAGEDPSSVSLLPPPRLQGPLCTNDAAGSKPTCLRP